MLGINTRVNWSHRFSQRLFCNAGYQFSRCLQPRDALLRESQKHFGRRGHHGQQSGAGELGAAAALNFASGIAGLSRTCQQSFNRNQTSAFRSDVAGATAAQHHVRRRFPAAAVQLSCRSRIRAARLPSPARLRAPISRTSCWAFPTPVRSRSATRTSTSAQSVYDAYITDDWRMRSGSR